MPTQLELEKLVSSAQTNWIEAVVQLDPNGVAALYDPEKGTLLGTVDTDQIGPRVGASAITSYFQHFLDRSGVIPDFPPIDQQQIQDLLGAVAASGYYSFQLTDHDGQVTQACAKFTYVYGPDGTILLHNSGLTPEGIINK